MKDEKVQVSQRVTLFAYFEKVAGTLAVTNESFLFMPSNPCLYEPIYQKFLLADVKYVLERRFLDANTALEIFLNNECSIFFVFESQESRNSVYESLGVKTDGKQLLLKNQKSWKKGELSNFEYLSFLNRMAGRTVHEISLYPIFPWVIADYGSENLDLSNQNSFRDLSKPVGALNEDKKLERLRDYSEEQRSSLYKKFYSSPEDVSNLLSRAYPNLFHQFRKNNNQANPSLFSNVSETFKSIDTDPECSNFELTQEFYEGNGIFLVNSKKWKEANALVTDVILPKWAKDAEDFVRMNRKALESEYASNHIRLWIDMIFGFMNTLTQDDENKQLFNELCYKTATTNNSTLNLVYNDERRQMYLLGQTPVTIFTAPHPFQTNASSVDGLRNELFLERQKRMKLEEEREKFYKELTTKKEQLKEMEDLMIKRDEEIFLLTNKLNEKSCENDLLKTNLDEMEKKNEMLKKKLEPNRKPDNIKYVNKYIVQLEEELTLSRRGELMRVKELERTHKELLEYKSKLDNEKETSDKYYYKMVELKKLYSQINDLNIEVNRLQVDCKEKEETILKLMLTIKEKEEEIKKMKTEKQTLVLQHKSMEMMGKDELP